MAFEVGSWKRLEFEKTPIYLHPDSPGWFVPNEAGDVCLQAVAKGAMVEQNPLHRRFFDRLPEPVADRFRGRAHHLRLEHLRELWFHITDRCNLACRHCLFASSPQRARTLEFSSLSRLARQAADLGCRVFALTGGEPTLHPQFAAIVDLLLGLADAHLVILTNGLTVNAFLDRYRWDRERLHLQVSVDGLGERHDAVRGRGSFRALEQQLLQLSRRGVPFTLSMCPCRANVRDMAPLVDFAARVGAANVHYMWYFVRGRGSREQWVAPDELFARLVEAAGRAEAHSISIDNLEALKTQVFAPPGTVHDGSTMGWESLAAGPDGRLYPSAALVGMDELAVDARDGLEGAWRDSPLFQEIRGQTAARLASPWRFFHGGGDPDHSYLHGGRFMGRDPYEPLQEKLMSWLIARQAAFQPVEGAPGLRLKMGDILAGCGAHGSVALTHSNCLLAVAREDSLSVVKNYYSQAVVDEREEILNPVCYPEHMIEHIPDAFRFRGYGCGSPVLEADLRAGDTVVDLGCGTGVECFIAARLVERSGRVIGVDMLDQMLAVATRGGRQVARRLGYDNLDFRKGYLESLPLESGSVDVAVSNCVLNLAVDKRRAFAEVFRVLRPGGRLVVADVVCEREAGPALRNDEALRGECIAGALTQKDLIALLEAAGFQAVRLVKRFPYRVVHGHRFYSLTFVACKTAGWEQGAVRVVYRGPFSSVLTVDGKTLTAGVVYRLERGQADLIADQLLILDDHGTVLNQDGESGCSCGLEPEAKKHGSEKESPDRPPAATGPGIAVKRRTGCMVCGASLHYQSSDAERTCSYCGRRYVTNVACAEGHYVCDDCHRQDALEVIRHLVVQTAETDMLKLLESIRRHPAIPIHGPEHHVMVPAIILATYRNLGGAVGDGDIDAALRRGSQVPGGACGFMGCCGAATGVGIAFSLILEATPIQGKPRRLVQTVTREVLAEITRLDAARCCQRESWIALNKAAELSRSLLPIALTARHRLRCRQQGENAHCLKQACPLNRRGISEDVADRGDKRQCC